MRGLRRFIEAIARPWFTPLIVAAGVVPYFVSLIFASSGTRTLSQGIDVLFGGADLLKLLSTSRLTQFYLLVLVIHLAARIAIAALRDGEPPRASEADAEHIMASAYRYAVVPCPDDWVERVRSIREGMRGAVSGECVVVWKFAPRWPKRVGQAGLLLLLAGVLLSGLTRTAGIVNVGEGQVISKAEPMPVYRYDWRFPSPGTQVTFPFKGLTIDAGGIDPAIGPDLNPVGGNWLVRWPIKATLLYDMGNGAEKVVVPTWLPAVVHGRLLAVTKIGLAPDISIIRGTEGLAGEYKVTTMFPGIGDSAVYDKPELPFVVRLRLIADKPFIVRGARYNAEVVSRRGKVLARGEVSPVSPLKWQDYQLDIADTTYWVGIAVIDDKGAWVVLVGALLAVVGGLAHAGVAAFAGDVRLAIVKEQTPAGDRLFAGAFASWSARDRAAQTLERLTSIMAAEDLPAVSPEAEDPLMEGPTEETPAGPDEDAS